MGGLFVCTIFIRRYRFVSVQRLGFHFDSGFLLVIRDIIVIIINWRISQSFAQVVLQAWA
jgi:hypothetical protein